MTTASPSLPRPGPPAGPPNSDLTPQPCSVSERGGLSPSPGPSGRGIRAIRTTSGKGVPYVGFALARDGEQAVLERVLRALRPTRDGR